MIDRKHWQKLSLGSQGQGRPAGPVWVDKAARCPC